MLPGVLVREEAVLGLGTQTVVSPLTPPGVWLIYPSGQVRVVLFPFTVRIAGMVPGIESLFTATLVLLATSF